MAYGYKRYRRYRKSRSNRLSARRVFGKTSAKAQASQINTLRKRINYVSRQCRPEMKVLYNDASSFSFDSQTVMNTYKSFLVPLPSLGSGDNQRVGDFIRIKSLQLNISAEYYNSSDSGYHNTESAGSAYRIIIGQYKQPTSHVPDISGVLQESSNSGAAYTNQSVCPMITGMTTFCHILFDKSYTISTNKNQVIHKLRVRPRNIRFQTQNSDVNAIWVIILSAGLHHDNNFSEFIKGTYSTKLVYTDA